jgi:hypothetical protein
MNDHLRSAADIVRYQYEGQNMADILIRGIPDDVVAAIDIKANRAGLSRAEYLRRALGRELGNEASEVTVADLSRLAETFADLGDPDLMARAWS